MTLGCFLDVAYALLVEEFQRLGMNLLEALDQTKGLGGRHSEQKRPKPSMAITTAAQNDAALAALEGMMSKVKLV